MASVYFPQKRIAGGASASVPISDGTKLVARSISGEITLSSTGVAAVVRSISPTWTGQHSFNHTPASGVANLWALALPQTPFASALGGICEIGPTVAFDGSTSGFFNGSSSGTYVAVNTPSGFSGNVLDVQHLGVSKLTIDGSGSLLAPTVTVSSLTASLPVVSDSGKQLASISYQNFLNAYTWTKGDLLYASATNVAAKLGIGSSGDLLRTSSGGVPEWFTPSYGTGTVTSFSAGNLSPLFTTSVATSTSTPALSFALSNAAQNAFLLGPVSGGAGAPTYRTFDARDWAGSSATGGLAYSTSSSATGWLAVGSANQFLGVAAGAPSWTSLSGDGTLSAGALTVTKVQGITYPSTLTTGDIYYASASNTLSKLAIGTASQVLTVVSGAPAWGNVTTVPAGTATTQTLYWDPNAIDEQGDVYCESFGLCTRDKCNGWIYRASKHGGNAKRNAKHRKHSNRRDKCCYRYDREEVVGIFRFHLGRDWSCEQRQPQHHDLEQHTGYLYDGRRG
jgi:hypothetical protein